MQSGPEESMTWYANHIYADGAAFAVLRGDSLFSRGLFRLPGGKYDSPHHPEATLRLKADLLVVRDICFSGGAFSTSWFQRNSDALLWTDDEASRVPLRLLPDLTRYFGDLEGGLPPPEFLGRLRTISQETKARLCYYTAATWGGLYECEAAFCFNPHLTGFFRAAEDSVDQLNMDGTIEAGASDSAIAAAIRFFGAEIGSAHASILTRQFPWESYRVR